MRVLEREIVLQLTPEIPIKVWAECGKSGVIQRSQSHLLTIEIRSEFFFYSPLLYSVNQMEEYINLSPSLTEDLICLFTRTTIVLWLQALEDGIDLNKCQICAHLPSSIGLAFYRQAS